MTSVFLNWTEFPVFPRIDAKKAVPRFGVQPLLFSFQEITEPFPLPLHPCGTG